MLAICRSVAAQSWPLYAAAVQSKTQSCICDNHFHLVGSQPPQKHLYLLYDHYLTYKTVNYNSNGIKKTCAFYFEKG